MSNRFAGWLKLRAGASVDEGVGGVGGVGDTEDASISTHRLQYRSQTTGQTPAYAGCLPSAAPTPQTEPPSGRVFAVVRAGPQALRAILDAPTPQTHQTAALDLDLSDSFEERAALVEFGAGVPLEWAEGFARLLTMACPAAVDQKRWRVLIDDCGRFLDAWSVRAAEEGWTTLEIFGAHAFTPMARYDLAGVAWLINGADVVSVTRESIVVQRPSGAGSVIRRRVPNPREMCVPAWELQARNAAANLHRRFTGGSSSNQARTDLAPLDWC
jgi:hypothetical protein